MKTSRITTTAIAFALLLGAANHAVAQQPQNGGQFGGGGRGGRGGFGMMGQRDVTLVQVPLSVMTTALSLTEEQQTNVKAIQTAMQTKQREAMASMGGGFGGRGNGDAPQPPTGQGGFGGAPGGGGGFGGGRGGSPEERQQRMEAMQTTMQELQTLDTRNSRAIQQLLTEEQKTALVPAMREWKIIQRMGLPLEITGELKLTEEQKTLLEKQLGTRNNRQLPGGGFGGSPIN